MCFGEVVAFSFPGKIGGTELEWRHGVPFSLGSVEVKVEEGVCLRSVGVWTFMVKFSEVVVDFSDLRRVDE